MGGEEEEGEDNEEQKMEKFFALIRNAKDVRDRLCKEKEDDDNKKVEEDKEKGVWKPNFEPEDFIHHHNDQDFGTRRRSSHLLAIPEVAGPSSSNHKELQPQYKENESQPEPEPKPEPQAHNEEEDDKENVGKQDMLDLTLSL